MEQLSFNLQRPKKESFEQDLKVINFCLKLLRAAGFVLNKAEINKLIDLDLEGSEVLKPTFPTNARRHISPKESYELFLKKYKYQLAAFPNFKRYVEQKLRQNIPSKMSGNVMQGKFNFDKYIKAAARREAEEREIDEYKAWINKLSRRPPPRGNWR